MVNEELEVKQDLSAGEIAGLGAVAGAVGGFTVWGLNKISSMIFAKPDKI